MNPGLLIGLLLLLLAFLTAAAEIAAQAMAREAGYLSFLDVLQIVTPDSLAAVRSFVRGTIHPALWDPVMTGAMALPGWLLFGVPGAVFVYAFRPRSEDGDDDEAPFNTYDDIVAAAEEADAEDWDPDETRPDATADSPGYLPPTGPGKKESD